MKTNNVKCLWRDLTKRSLRKIGSVSSVYGALKETQETWIRYIGKLVNSKAIFKVNGAVSCITRLF